MKAAMPPISKKNHYHNHPVFFPLFWKNIHASKSCNNGWNKISHGQVLGKQQLSWSPASTPHSWLDLSMTENLAMMFEFHSSATSLFSLLTPSPARISL